MPPQLPHANLLMNWREGRNCMYGKIGGKKDRFRGGITSFQISSHACYNTCEENICHLWVSFIGAQAGLESEQRCLHLFTGAVCWLHSDQLFFLYHVYHIYANVSREEIKERVFVLAVFVVIKMEHWLWLSYIEPCRLGMLRRFTCTHSRTHKQTHTYMHKHTLFEKRNSIWYVLRGNLIALILPFVNVLGIISLKIDRVWKDSCKGLKHLVSYCPPLLS